MTDSREGQPLVVGIGGTTRERSSSERALAVALDAARDAGARVLAFGAEELALPMYAPEVPTRTPEAERLVASLRDADGVIVSSPGYHGGVSGLIKNALDYVEDLREGPQPYLDGRAVGCIVCAHGWQATATTLVALRSVIHSLRGWPTPLGAAINSAEEIWNGNGELVDPRAAMQLETVGRQVVAFANSGMRWRAR